MTEAVTLEVGGVQYDVAPSAVAIRLLGLDGTEIAKLDNTGRWASPDGTVALPGITFPSDPDTGIYRISANRLGIAVGGTKIVDVTASGATVTGAFTATTSVTGTTGLISNAGVYITAAIGATSLAIDMNGIVNANIRGGSALTQFLNAANSAVNVSIADGGTVSFRSIIDGTDPTGVGLTVGAGAGSKLGFYGHAPTAQQTGVAVSAAGVHAALVALGLITA